MSPEQAAGTPELDGRSDLYSLGLIGYEMLAGATPFDASTPADLVLQRLSRDPPPLSPRAPEAPAWLTGAITRCLARDPAARWPDARAFRRQLLAGGAESDLPVALATLNAAAQLGALAWAYGAGEWIWAKATRVVTPFFSSTPTMGSSTPNRFCGPLPHGAPAVVVEPRHAAKGVLLGGNWPRSRPPTPLVDGVVSKAGPRPRRRVAAASGHVRMARIFLSIGLVVPFPLFLLGAIDEATMDRYQRTGTWIGLALWIHKGGTLVGPTLMAALLLATLVAAIVIARSLQTLRRGPLPRGGEDDEVWPVFTRATANARFWSKPAYRAVLDPPCAPASRRALWTLRWEPSRAREARPVLGSRVAPGQDRGVVVLTDWQPVAGSH